LLLKNLRQVGGARRDVSAYVATTYGKWQSKPCAAKIFFSQKISLALVDNECIIGASQGETHAERF
jgi:hypothetical protein